MGIAIGEACLLENLCLISHFRQGFSYVQTPGVQLHKEEHMEDEKKNLKRLPWHAGFYASIQIELEEDAENLIFENEH